MMRIKNFIDLYSSIDAKPEWAYDRNLHIEKLDKGLDEAIEKNWTVVDMKKDWKIIHPFEELNP